jgi:hypothetical protein
MFLISRIVGCIVPRKTCIDGRRPGRSLLLFQLFRLPFSESDGPELECLTQLSRAQSLTTMTTSPQGSLGYLGVHSLENGARQSTVEDEQSCSLVLALLARLERSPMRLGKLSRMAF